MRVITGVIFLISFIITYALTIDLGAATKKPDPNKIVLSDNNTVTLNMPITDSVANQIQTQLLDKSDHLPSNKPIYLFLNSPGGSIDAGNRIIALAKGLPQKVHTITMFSASMSFQISQNLDDRYIVADGVMMSHRAFIGGVSGNVPGSALVRLYNALEMVTRLDTIASGRAGMDFEYYQNLIKDELWMTSETAQAYKFADREVLVTCDKTLRGAGQPTFFQWLFGTVKLTYHKCPLIAAPLEQEGDNSLLEILNGSKQNLVKTFSY